ncbi:unnamed protein product, partial [Prorocentrum cordatum]
EDEDGDTPLGAVMAIASDGVQGDPEKEVDEDTAKAQLAQLAAVRALVSCPQLPLPPEKVWELTSWLRSTFPSRLHGEFLADLRARVGNKEVDKAWCSEMMMQYLEDTAYDNKEGVSAAKVRDFLDGGARPGHKTNSATALLLVVLNPYSTLAELTEVFRLMLSVDPAVATERDNFKLSALQWAADYRSVSSQHGLRQPNPATFLALLPVLVSLLPPELDAGETCYKTSPDGFCTASPTGRAAFHPRFMEGDRVDVRVDAPGEGCVWEEGVVIGLWYRESCWPAEHPGAPYQVRLDIGTQVFALVDHDRIISTRGRPRRRRADGEARQRHRCAEGEGRGEGPQALPEAPARGRRLGTAGHRLRQGSAKLPARFRRGLIAGSGRRERPASRTTSSPRDPPTPSTRTHAGVFALSQAAL